MRSCHEKSVVTLIPASSKSARLTRPKVAQKRDWPVSKRFEKRRHMRQAAPRYRISSSLHSLTTDVSASVQFRIFFWREKDRRKTRSRTWRELADREGWGRMGQIYTRRYTHTQAHTLNSSKNWHSHQMDHRFCARKWKGINKREYARKNYLRENAKWQETGDTKYEWVLKMEEVGTSNKRRKYGKNKIWKEDEVSKYTVKSTN